MGNRLGLLARSVWRRGGRAGVGFQVLDQPADLTTAGDHMLRQGIEFFRLQVPDVAGDVALGPQFARGSPCAMEKTDEHRPRLTFIPFRDVGDDGNRRPADLVPQSKVSCKRLPPRDGIDRLCQLSRLLPNA